MPVTPEEQARISEAKETLDNLYAMSQLLETGLDKQTLSTCISMIEAGANPENLAAVIQELRAEKAAAASAGATA